MRAMHINKKALSNIFSRKKKNKVTVLDLFFDITLMVFIGGISHELIGTLAPKQGDIEWSKVFTGILELFTIFFIWRIYMIFAMYTFQSISYRILTMIVMASLVAMGIASYFAASTKAAFLLNIVGFDIAMLAITIAYALISLPLLKTKGIKSNPIKRAITLITSFVLAIVIASVALGLNYTSYSDGTKRIIILALWALNLVQLFALEFLSSKWSWKYEEAVVDLFEERYNILFVLFCGEGIITMVTTFAGMHNGGDHIFDASFWYLIMAFFAIFGTWWIFNDYITYTKLKRNNKHANAFTYIMLPYLASITTFFIGISLMIQGHNYIGSVVVAFAFATIGILFPLLLMLQEPFRDEHMYVRRRKFEVYLAIFGSAFGTVVVIIDVLLPIPFLVLGVTLVGVLLWIILAFAEYIHSLNTCKGDKDQYKKVKEARIKKQIFK